MASFPPDSRVYSEQEERTLAEQLQTIAARLHGGEFRERGLDVVFLCEIHAALFRGVRGHAGQYRRDGYGQEYLTFGPNRSVNRAEVPAQLATIFEQATRNIRALDPSQEREEHEISAITTAVWLHAEIIRIHPFEDGNGRTSRLILDWVLLRLGLPMSPLEVPKQEYRACLNLYFAARDLAPLRDLYVRLLFDGLSKPSPHRPR